MRTLRYTLDMGPTWIVGLLVAALLAMPASAQQTGSVTGSVTNAQTLRPIAGAQVVLTGPQIGGLTNTQGRFLVQNVPAGQHTISVQVIGYGEAQQTVTVQPGAVAEANFQLEELAVDLEELIVTGTPGATRRRAIGTSVSSVDVENQLQDAGITSVQDLLSGREAGMTTIANTGLAGGGGNIQLRGMTSMSVSNKPVIYIDGIRLDNDESSQLVYLGGQQSNPLNEIDPNDIARIEVIKGAAATTLYGSEASNGVIQIFTKRGRTGEMVVNLSTRHGFNDMPNTIYRQHIDPQYPDPNEDLVKKGLHQEYTASVRGGMDRITYFASVSHQDSEGAFINNEFQRSSARVNLSFNLGPVTTDISTSLARSNAAFPINDNVTSGILTSIHLGNPVTRASAEDPWGGAFFPAPYNISRERTQSYDRWVGGVTFNHSFADAFDHRLTVGADLSNGEGISFNPYAQGQYPSHSGLLLGSKSVARRNNLQTNIDYSMTWSTPVSSNIESQLSFGGQLFMNERRDVSSTGNDFPSPGLTLVDAAGRASVDEGESSYATGGLFVQEQLGFGDRFFLTGGVRVDGSSVFGDDFGFQTYPKVSASWVVGEEEWFNLPGFSSLRLRGGFGMAGNQPGAFDALRTYVPVSGVGGVTGFQPGNPGNPELAPEVSREIEAGFDAGLFDERVSVTTTFYHQTTTDAILAVPAVPSEGFGGNRDLNVGKVRNRGVELGVDWSAVEGRDFRWSLGAGYAYNDNEVLEMPGVSFVSIDRFGTRAMVGYPIATKWERMVVGTDGAGMPIVSDTAVHLGNGIPPHTGHINTEVQWGSFRLASTAAWAADYIMSFLTRPYAYSRRTGEDYFRELAAAGGTPTPEMEFKRTVAEQAPGEFYEHVNWLRIREISLSYATANESFLGGILGSAPRFFMTARNPILFTNYTGTDPEIASTGGNDNNAGRSVSADYFSVPTSMQFIFGIDVRF